MKTISLRQTETALFNLDSMRIKLLNESYEAYERGDYKLGEKIDKKIEEVESLLEKMHFNHVTISEWKRILDLVAERQLQRYETYLKSITTIRSKRGK